MRRLLQIAVAVAALFVGSPWGRANTGLVPINDLGTGLYLNQYQGGLYPGGSNTMPVAHSTSHGVTVAATISAADRCERWARCSNVTVVASTTTTAAYAALAHRGQSSFS